MASENACAAKIENGIVTQVIVIPDQGDDDAAITAYCNSIGIEGEWILTTYPEEDGSVRVRGKYAGQGDLYDAELDEFVTPVSDLPIPDETPLP